MEDILILKEKSELSESVHWSQIKKYMTEKITNLSTSNIDPIELKGLLKFIAIVDSWTFDYRKEMNKLKNEK